MGKVIAVSNQKGGVGKTTTCVNLTAALGLAGVHVLLVDLDPQGNTTSGFGVNKKDLGASSYEMLIGKVKGGDAIIHTPFRGVDIIPSGMALAGAELELVDMAGREQRVKKELLPLTEKYDYIFMDCPPSLGLITLNALVAADTVIIPIQCEYYALEGLSQLISTIRQVKRTYNPNLDIEGVLLTMYDGRLNLTQQVVNEVKRFFPRKVFETVIPRTVRLSEAPSYGQPIQYFDRRSKGAHAYDKLAKELIKKNRR